MRSARIHLFVLGGFAGACVFPPLQSLSGRTIVRHPRGQCDPAGQRGTGHRIRTDLSATLFFSQPEEYDGGELSSRTPYGVHRVKLPAGHLILYPSTSLHHVTPVTRRSPVVIFLDLKTLVRDMASALFCSISTARFNAWLRPSRRIPQWYSSYRRLHNLLRRWAEDFEFGTPFMTPRRFLFWIHVIASRSFLTNQFPVGSSRFSVCWSCLCLSFCPPCLQCLAL